jgi:DNA (cytosine-5)-methyltransferase 1
VFVVGYLGDWQRAAAVLFERESVCRNPAPSREKGQDAAKCLTAGVEKRYDFETETLPVAFHNRQDPDVSGSITHPLGANDNGMAVGISGDVAGTLDANYYKGCGSANYGEREVVAQPVMFSIMPMNSGKDYKAREVEVAQPLMAGGPVGGNQGGDYVAQPSAFPINTLTLGGRPDPVNDARMTLGVGADGDPQFTLQAAHSHAVATAMQVRRLTPVECERLQGFPDNYTNIPWRKKPESPDGPRYKALGNSMAVPVMRWIGGRIANVENR